MLLILYYQLAIKIFPPRPALFTSSSYIRFAIYTQQYAARSLYSTVEIWVKCMLEEDDAQTKRHTSRPKII